MAVLIGTNTATGGGDFFGAGECVVSKYTASSSGDVGVLKVAITGGTFTSLKLAIYADDGTTNFAAVKLGETGSITDNTTGTKSSNLVAPVTVVSGTQYWLGVLPLGGNVTFGDVTGGLYRGRASQATFPDPFGTQTFDDTGNGVPIQGETAAGTSATVTAVVSDSAGSAPVAGATFTAGTDTLGYANGLLGAPWVAWTGTMPTIASGVAINPGVFRDTTYPVVADSADCQCETLFSAAPNPTIDYNFGVGVRLTAHSSAANGYMFEVQANGGTGWVPKLYRGSAFTLIATGSTVVSAAVTGMRVTAVGSTITGYLNISGVWTLVVTVSDATYSAAGYPGFWIQNLGGSAVAGVDQVSWGAPAGTDATVTAVTARSNGSAAVATISAGATITAAIADSAGTAPPANQIVSIVIGAPAVVSLGSAPSASVSAGGGNATVTAATALSSGSAPVAAIAAGATVTAVVADSVGSAPAATLAQGATVNAVPAMSTGQAPRPGLSPSPTGSGGLVALATTFAEDSA